MTIAVQDAIAEAGPETARDPAAAPAAAGRRPAPRPARPAVPPSRARPWLVAAAWLLAAGLLFTCYLRLSWTVPVNSDGAGNALQAWDMLHGNLLLHGWQLSDVSFYTTELPQYLLIELALGLTSGVVHVAGALTYTLVVLLAALLGRGQARGRAGLARAGVTAGILLAPQLGDGTYVLILSPDHVGTAVPVLAAWLILDRARPRWYLPVAIAALLAWALVADPLAAYIGILPLAAACAVRAYRGAIQQRQPWSAQWYELSLCAAALAAIVAGWLAAAALHGMGGYAVAPLHGSFTSVAALPGHLLLGTEAVLLLFGADFFGQRMGLTAAAALLHLAGAGVAGRAVVVAARRFFRDLDLVPAILVAAVAVNLAAFGFGTLVVNVRSAREMAAVLPFGAVLAARLLGARLTAPRLRPLTLVVLLGYLAILGREVARPPAAPQDQRLAAWLAARHLDAGLAAYWQANGTTLASGGRVQVSPVCARAGRFTREQWESESAWYDPQRQYADFLVLGGSAFCNNATVAQASAAFGRPAQTGHVAGYTILIWDKNLLTRLG